MFNLTSHCLAPPLEVYGAPLGGRAPQFKNHCARVCLVLPVTGGEEEDEKEDDRGGVHGGGCSDCGVAMVWE